jgi:hypothetical protein
MSLDCRPDRLAMQKVVGSSPIIRSTKGPGTALRWLQRFIDERLPPLAEVALAASALAELRHGHRDIGLQTLKQLLRRG